MSADTIEMLQLRLIGAKTLTWNVKEGTYKNTLAELVSSQKTKKRTDAIIDRLYRRLGDESIVMTFVNGNEITPVEFKKIHDFDTKIILKYIETQEESNGESGDKAQEAAKAEPDTKTQEAAKTATDDETAEAADAATETDNDGEDQALEAPKTSEPNADKKEYEDEEHRDSIEDFFH